MNAVERSSHRDRKVLRYIDTLGALTTEQVRCLCFSDMATGERKAQQRLRRMFDLGLVKRIRPSLDSPLVYWTEQRPLQLEHAIARNWVYCWLVKHLMWWEKVAGWYPEEDYEVLRCDALAQVKNTVTHKSRFLFVEVDLSENRFDKVQKYTELCRRGIDAWWAEEATVFPEILVVTEGRRRLETIRKAIKEQNALGLKFDMRLLSDVKRSALECKQLSP